MQCTDMLKAKHGGCWGGGDIVAVDDAVGVIAMLERLVKGVTLKRPIVFGHSNQVITQATKLGPFSYF